MSPEDLKAFHMKLAVMNTPVSAVIKVADIDDLDDEVLKVAMMIHDSDLDNETKRELVASLSVDAGLWDKLKEMLPSGGGLAKAKSVAEAKVEGIAIEVEDAISNYFRLYSKESDKMSLSDSKYNKRKKNPLKEDSKYTNKREKKLLEEDSKYISVWKKKLLEEIENVSSAKEVRYLLKEGISALYSHIQDRYKDQLYSTGITGIKGIKLPDPDEVEPVNPKNDEDNSEGERLSIKDKTIEGLGEAGKSLGIMALKFLDRVDAKGGVKRRILRDLEDLLKENGADIRAVVDTGGVNAANSIKSKLRYLLSTLNSSVKDNVDQVRGSNYSVDDVYDQGYFESNVANPFVKYLEEFSKEVFKSRINTFKSHVESQLSSIEKLSNKLDSLEGSNKKSLEREYYKIQSNLSDIKEYLDSGILGKEDLDKLGRRLEEVTDTTHTWKSSLASALGLDGKTKEEITGKDDIYRIKGVKADDLSRHELLKFKIQKQDTESYNKEQKALMSTARQLVKYLAGQISGDIERKSYRDLKLVADNVIIENYKDLGHGFENEHTITFRADISLMFKKHPVKISYELSIEDPRLKVDGSGRMSFRMLGGEVISSLGHIPVPRIELGDSSSLLRVADDINHHSVSIIYHDLAKRLKSEVGVKYNKLVKP